MVLVLISKEVPNTFSKCDTYNCAVFFVLVGGVPAKLLEKISEQQTNSAMAYFIK
jgi:hypothetical protein